MFAAVDYWSGKKWRLVLVGFVYLPHIQPAASVSTGSLHTKPSCKV